MMDDRRLGYDMMLPKRREHGTVTRRVPGRWRGDCASLRLWVASRAEGSIRSRGSHAFWMVRSGLSRHSRKSAPFASPL